MDIKSFVLGQASAGGGGDITVESLSATENKTYTAPTGKAYSPVVVNVPGPTLQTKSATPTTSSQEIEPDSGYLLSKVTVAAIPSQYIVPTGTKSITENGTGIDVAQYAAVDVAVPSGGGSSYTLIHSEEITDSYSSTSAGTLITIDLSDFTFTTDKMLYVCVKDKAGPREGYFAASVNFGFIRSISPSFGFSHMATGFKKIDTGYTSRADCGIYVSGLASNGALSIDHKYHSTTGTIDGTYTIEVYLLDYAPGGNPFS